MITFADSSSKESMEETEKYLDSQLWHACAGGMVQMPPLNSMVYYFPQGHAEHAYGNVDFSTCQRVLAFVLCKVADVKFMADHESDEVYARIRLVPARNGESNYVEDDGSLNRSNGPDVPEKLQSFAKTLTQSDANNGGGFSVPRYCAETIFPRLDYSADPPVQTVLAKDVHGEVWKFRHIYRGTPRRHLLTTGWSTFVNQKKLVAGDSIVFLRTENGDLCVGIRRAKRGVGCGPETPSGWNSAAGNCVSPFGGFSALLRDDEGKLMRNASGNSNCSMGFRGKARVRAEAVAEAARLAANGQPFEVVYYPRASTPEFCVKAASVRAAMRIQWHAGMRFKMPFETEDCSRISWFMGTISGVQVADPIRWPNSPWRLLQVNWDEQDLMQNVKRVSPWLVELVSNMPAIHLAPFSPQRKKMRLPQHPDFPLDSQYPTPTFSSNPLGCSSPLCYPLDNTPAGIQGARHAQLGISLSDLHLNKLQTGLFPFQHFDHPVPDSRISSRLIAGNPNNRDNISCSLNIGNSEKDTKKPDDAKVPQFLLFGQPILTEQQISQSCSGDTISPGRTGNSSSDGNPDKATNFSSDGLPDNSSCEGVPQHKGQQTSELGLETGPRYRDQQTSKLGLQTPLQYKDQRTSELGLESGPRYRDQRTSEIGLEMGLQYKDQQTSELGLDTRPWYKDQRTSEPCLETGHCKVFMETEDVGRTLDLSVLGSYEELYRKLAKMFGIEKSEMINHVLYQDVRGSVKHTGEEPFSEFKKTARRLTILMDSGSDNTGR